MEDMDFLAHEMKSAVGAPASVGKGISKWEWLPPIAVAVLAAVYFLTATGSTANRFALFVGLGLVPGSLWRLAGKPSWNIHRLFFALALIIFVLDNPKLRPDAESWLMIKRNWGLVAIGFVISFTQPLWGMLRTHRLLIDGGIVITYFNSLKLCLSGNFFNIFLPGSTGGDAYRVWAITDGYKKRLAPAIASITLDRLLGLPSLILVVVFGMLVDYDFFLQHRMLAGLIPFLAGAGVLCIVLVVYLMFAGKSGRRIASMSEDEASRLGKPPGRLRRMHLRISANIKRPATLPLALFYGFMSHLACIAACQCFGLALNVQGIPMWRYYLIIPLVMTINSIPGAPGGVGQGELAMATLFDMAYPNAGNLQLGVVVMLLFRLSNMAIGVIGGVFYAMGKTDLVGLSQVSQGVTRVIHRRLSNTVAIIRQKSFRGKRDSNRFRPHREDTRSSARFRVDKMPERFRFGKMDNDSDQP